MEHPLERLAAITLEVEPVGNLNSAGRGLPRATGVLATAVAADELGRVMRAEPVDD
jgi:hypothetical protein